MESDVISENINPIFSDPLFAEELWDRIVD